MLKGVGEGVVGRGVVKSDGGGEVGGGSDAGPHCRL